MNRKLLIVFVSALVIGLGACATSGGGSADAAADSGASDYPAGYSAPPANSKLAKISLGMMETDVRRILGEPNNSNAYMTGKAWIPFYFGSDVARSDWFYSGLGRIVFSRNRYTGALKVIKVLYNPNEP